MMQHLFFLAFVPFFQIKQASAQCTSSAPQYTTPSKGRCLTFARGNTYTYPDDFGDILNEVAVYTCETSDLRVIISNGIPDHMVVQGNPHSPCEINYAVEIPLNPTVSNDKTEVPVRNLIAMAINGVPAFGPQEAGDDNAVEPTGPITDAQFWYGHAAANNNWHFHNPHMGKETVDDTTFLGFAMDGFPIFGPLADDSGLDDCNGVSTPSGGYQYHVRTKDQVDADLDYCKSSSDASNNWNYILGCYSGSISKATVQDSTSYVLPVDCVRDAENPTGSPSPTGTPSSTAPTPKTTDCRSKIRNLIDRVLFP